MAHRTALPERVRLVLQAAQSAERSATGTDRRQSFETTRILMGGTLEAGYTTQAICDCLGLKRDSVKGRAETGRELSLAALAAVAGLDPEALAGLGHPALFGPARLGEDGQPYYRADAIVRGLATLA